MPSTTDRPPPATPPSGKGRPRPSRPPAKGVRPPAKGRPAAGAGSGRARGGGNGASTGGRGRGGATATAPRARRPATHPTGRRSLLWRHRRILFLLGLFGFTAVSGVLYLLARMPLPRPAPQAETTLLTDITGARLASLDAGENRVPVRLDEVPQVLRDAVLAVEDRNFYEHGALDPVGLVRATLADLRGRPLQGGSTITQQYVKNTYLDRERTIWRKLKEASLAVKVERSYSKDEILERYLNTVYFGRGAYGVQAAARAYFGKDVGQIDLPSAAYLAGLIRAPEAADVTRAADQAKVRRDLALRAMERDGRISGAERRAAEAVPLPAAEGGHVVDRASQEPQVVMTEKGTQYFVEYVRSQLVARFGEDATYRRGLRVRTTLDPGLQAEAYDAVYGYLKPEEPAAALVAVDAEGRIRAMVGGRDFAESKVNLALGRDGGGTGRQAGSTFKPFLLAALARDGYSVQQSTFAGPPQVVFPKADQGKDYPVANYEDADFGASLNLIEATKSSVNTVYAQAQHAYGSQKVVDMAHALGVRSELEPTASLVLGTEEVSVLEMAGAYSTFARRGVRVDPHAILEVTTADGTVLPWERPAPVRALQPNHADVVNHALQQVVSGGSGSGAAIGRPVAGKTGTTQDFGDAWFVGYTPKLTTAVWMGYPEGNARKMLNVRGRKVNGGSFPATMFKRFMQTAVRNPEYAGAFPAVTEFPGKVLKPRTTGVVIPTTTTTSAPAATPAGGPTGSTGSTTTSAPTDPTTVPGRKKGTTTTAPTAPG